jgi:hypothetical protein
VTIGTGEEDVNSECTVKERQVEIKEKIKKLLNMNDIDHVTVEIEFADEVNLEEKSDI